LLRQTMEAQGMESVVMHGFRWTPSPEPYPIIEDRDQLKAWLEQEHPHEWQVPHQAVKRLLKSALKGEDQMPAGVGVFMSHSFSVRKKEE
ncbi:MAG TPA: hypothetical protein VJS19_13940, partial [Candidatus Dormibacteraeota bacterium]|nr:hypothetical protein [Candidatus Dormibacteraeota bacterium]